MLKLLILALAAVQIAQSTSFEQTRDCLHGPEFWCKSVQNARECGAFKHCLDTVWSMHHRYLRVNKEDGSCDSCVECLHGDSKKCPNVELHLDEIADMFMASIPSYTICKLVDGCKPVDVPEDKVEHRVELSACLKLHPRTWCDSIENARTCNSIDYCRENIWSKLKPMVLNEAYHNSDGVCGFCIWTFNKLHEILQQNLTEFSVEQYLLGACTLFPSKDDQKKCTDAVNENYAELYNLVRNSMDPGIICRVIKLCKDEHLTEKKSDVKVSIKVLNPDDVVVTSPLKPETQHLLGSKSELSVVKLSKTSGVACELCTMVLNGAKFLLENEKDEQEVLGFITKQLCGRLGSLNATCVEYITTEGKQILDALMQNVDPSLLCHKMGLCLQIQVTSPNTKRFFDMNVKDGQNCTLCKLVMTEVKTMLANKKSEDQILDYIRKNLCEKSNQYSEMCKTVVTAYGPLLLEFISNDINPTQICQLIGLCQKKTEEQKPEPVSEKADQYCALCEFVMTTLQSFIAANSSSTEVEKWLEYVCEAMPATIRDECKKFVDEYEPIIVSLLANQIQPQKVCQFIGVCPKSADFKVENLEAIKAKLSELQLRDNRPQCTICEFVLSVLSGYITQNSSAAEVEKWLEYVCKSVMPSTIKQECADFVAEYGPIIIQLLANQVQPQKICSIIKLCGNTQVETPKPVEKVELQVPPVVYCDACQFTLQFLEYELRKDKSKESVTKAIENVCKVAPGSMRDNCNSIVETYGPYLIDLLEKYAEPLAVCYRIKLCPSKVESKVEDKVSAPSVELTPAKQQTKNDRLKLDKQEKVADLKCSLCIYVAEVIDGLLKQNKTDEEIKDALEKVCNYFPSTLKDQCLSFMDEYAVYVLELLADDLDPQQACEKIGVCPSFSEISHVDFRGLLKIFRDKMMHRGVN